MKGELEKPRYHSMDQDEEQLFLEQDDLLQSGEPESIHRYLMMQIASQQRLIMKLLAEIDEFTIRHSKDNLEINTLKISSSEGQRKLDQIFDQLMNQGFPHNMGEQSRNNAIELRKILGLSDKPIMHNPKEKLSNLFTGSCEDDDSLETLKSMRDMDE